MAHIVSFSIDDLAGRKEPCSFELNPSVNLFFGLNGTGKTSLLKILHAALSGTAEGLSRVPFSRAEVRISTGSGEVVVRRIDQGWAKRPRLREVVDEDGDVIVIREEGPAWETTPPEAPSNYVHAYLPTTRLFSSASGSRGRLLARRGADTSEEALDAEFASLLELLWSRYAAEISKQVQTAQEAGLVSVLTQILDDVRPHNKPRTVDFEVSYARVRRFLRRANAETKTSGPAEFLARYEQNETLRYVVDSLSNVEEQIELAQRPRTNLQAMLNRLFNNKTVSLGSGKLTVLSAGEVSIPLSALSSGEKHMLRLLVEVLTAPARSPIIIDEPELSLHVDWQQELVSDVRDLKPDSQLILATHSPEVMAPVSDDQVFRL